MFHYKAYSKIFVGGLSMLTTAESLRKYFKHYGDVTDSSLMLDRETSKSRGFGFITFKDPAAVARVLANKAHIVDGKIVDCKEAISKSSDNSLKNGFRTRKIFVGGLPHELSEEAFGRYFERYGKVVHCQIMKDRDTSKPRGFGFVTFDSEEAVERVIRNLKEHKFMGKWVECKKATPSAKTAVSVKQKIETYGAYVKSSPYYYQNAKRSPYKHAEEMSSEYYRPYTEYSRQSKPFGGYNEVNSGFMQQSEEYKQFPKEYAVGAYAKENLAGHIDYSRSFSQAPAYSGFFTDIETANLMSQPIDSFQEGNSRDASDSNLKTDEEDLPGNSYD
eukprot:TRINITY_DN1326_c0_g2_i2.p1 TRINITY_DN1326_c0_g2~~TRINITY_DN1326_c0_g2_i2.p1  ORF type:complete len:332 (+),score=62.44 TRINITY_DN1326_c0_g2_i2:207-1202(+)